MKAVIRLALPALNTLTPDSLLPFALLDRQRTVLRSGELSAQALAQGMPTRHAQVILHPSDTVQLRLAVPPLASARMGAAVRALVEPMVLSAPDDLAIGHGPRRADGMLEVAWTARAPLARAWSMLADAGLQVTGIYPACHIAPQAADSDAGADMHATPALALPADERWRHPAPDWSLALPELRPVSQGDGRWRMPAIYGAAAALVWIVGLNVYAGQLSREFREVNRAMQRQVTQAFPTIGIVSDPLKQARQRRDRLRAGQGDALAVDGVAIRVCARARAHTHA